MKITPLGIAGAAVIQAEPRGDERGVFARWFCKRELAELLGEKQVVSINYSCTEDAGTIRGMHYQRKPALDMRFARCIRGEVYDVILDLRANSPTFLQWHAERLTSQEMNMIAVPEGVAHGFQAIEPGSEMLYLHTGYYVPEHEGGVRFDDPAIGIDWPMAPTVVSQRDRSHPLLDESFRGIEA